MKIKSSKTLLDEASKEEQTLNPLQVKELAENKKYALIDIRATR